MSHIGRMGINDPRTDQISLVDPAGALRISEATRLVGPMFQSTRDTIFWTATTSSGTVTYTDSAEVINSGAASTNFARLESVRKARFMFANPNMWRGIIKIATDPPAGGGKIIFGAIDPTGWDLTLGGGGLSPTGVVISGGFHFLYSAANGLELHCRHKDYEFDRLVNGQFNGEVSSWTNDGLAHAFEIVYWKAGAQFYIDGVLIGSIGLSDPGSPYGINGMDMKAVVAAYISSGFSGAAEVSVYAMTILRLGKEHSVPISKYLTGTDTLLKRGSGELHHVTVTDNTGVCTIYDNTTNSGTILAVIDASKTVGTLVFNSNFEIGLYADFSGQGTTPKMTFVYE